VRLLFGYILQQLLIRCVVGVKGQVIPIDVLPDDVLLAVFDFCAVDIMAWQPLVHVCRHWRCVIFGSPRRLNLRLVCTAKTPARDMLDVWPALPIYIRDMDLEASLEETLHNIIAALERSDRVREIDLWPVSSSHLETLLAAMQVPFPELTLLELWSYGEVVLPDSFLGGSAPRLRSLWLDGIPIPGLPKLLSSATHLVHLRLENIPHSGYISPEAMATALSTLTRLERLTLKFKSPLSRPDRSSPLPTRSVPSVLTHLTFKGDSEYLEGLVAHIGAPLLNGLNITFFNDIIFRTPQLIRFICRTPMFKAPKTARVVFGDRATTVVLSSRTSGTGLLHVKIMCRELDWQVSSVQQIFTSSLPSLSMLEDLYIDKDEGLSSQSHSRDDIENSLWVELLHPFRAVENLYLSEEFALRIVPALQELDGIRVAEVLPTLQNIFLESLEPSGPVQEGIQQFVAMRQVSEVTSDPISVSLWDRGQD